MTQRWPIAMALLCLALGSSSPSAATRLAPARPDLRLEGEGLERSAVFARIDSLEASFRREKDGPSRGHIAHRLGQLYLATGLLKHKRKALDLLKQAIQLDENLFEAGQLRANTAHAMRYPSTAEKWFRRLTESFPRDPRALRALGRFHYLEARGVLDPDHFEQSRRAYADCLEADPGNLDCRLGLAASHVALEQFESLLEVTPPLLSHDDGRVAGLLFEGAALASLKDDDAAHGRFEEAMTLDPSLRDAFLDAQGFLLRSHLEPYAAQADSALLESAMRLGKDDWQPGDDFDLGDALQDSLVRRDAVARFWRENNTHPSRLSNELRLLYWKRLVEAEVLFGDPRENVRGWTREMGEALVRWGRPTRTRYIPASFGDVLDEIDGLGLRGESLPGQTAFWVWSYKRPGENPFALLFQDPTYQFQWKAGSTTSYNLAAWRKTSPLQFPEATEPDPPMRLRGGVARFPRSNDGTTLEVFVGVETQEGFGSGAVPRVVGADSTGILLAEWAVFDRSGKRIEYLRRSLDEGRRRSTLLAALGAPPLGGGRSPDPVLFQIGAQLPPGRYTIALDVTEVHGGGHVGNQWVVDLDPPATGLALSDLQLAASFAPYSTSMEVPPEFVKYAYGIVPVPDGAFPHDAERLYVYYEVYDLSVDDTGRTRFNVSYELYRQRDHDRGDGESLRSQRRDGLDRLDPLTTTYIEERTGRSAQHHVVKGSAVDIRSLGPGRYVLVVTVDDLLGEDRTSAQIPFLKLKRPQATVGGS